MAIEVELPDGTVVEFPDGTDQATMERALAQYAQQPPPQQPRPPQEAPPDPTEGMGGWDQYRSGLGRSLVRTYRGGKQFGTESWITQSALASGLLDKIGAKGAANAVRRYVGSPLARSLSKQQATIDEQERLDAPLLNTSAGYWGDVTGQVAQAALPLAGPASRALTAGGRLARLGGSAADAALFAATQPVASGGSRADNMLTSAAFGAAGRGVADGMARIGKGMSDKLSPFVREAYERAQQAGIPVHFSQVSGSKAAKTLASALGYLPFTGAGAAAQRQQEAFNRAVSRSFGADAANLSDDVMTAARQKIGSAYKEVFDRSDVRLDDAALSQLANIERTLRTKLKADEIAVVKANIDEILENSQNGVMPGGVYQSLRESLRGDETKLGAALKEVRAVLDQAAFRSVGPQDAALLKRANAQWANMKTTERALKQVEGAKGNVRPAALWPLVNQSGKSTREMRELAKVGQLIKDPIPDSGTAARFAAYASLSSPSSILGGVSGGIPGALAGMVAPIAVGSTVGRALNSRLAAKYLAEGSKTGQRVAKLVRPAPYALPAVARTSGITIGGGTPGPWTAEDDAELERLRAEAALLRAQYEGY